MKGSLIISAAICFAWVLWWIISSLVFYGKGEVVELFFGSKWLSFWIWVYIAVGVGCGIWGFVL